MTETHHRPRGFSVIDQPFYEGISASDTCEDLWIYTDHISYAPGMTVTVHGYCTIPQFALSYQRDDGISPMIDLGWVSSPGCSALPDRFWETGCDWPECYRFEIPEETNSGFYLLRATAKGATGKDQIYEHGFFVKSAERKRNALLVAATSTWVAYNDWGGANAYSLPGARSDGFATRLTLHRPWARGFMALDPVAPRKPHRDLPGLDEPPRYPPIEYAYANGLSKWYANAGWASYERPFCHWAERHGFQFDYATQHDLDRDPELLNDYGCVIVVGHDEYWSWAMRDAIDKFVERGGRFARFGGNLAWQVRLESNATAQICFKDNAATDDPLSDTRLRTSIWDDPVIARPPETTFGLSAIWGIYAGVGGQAARGPGGFSVYRPEHWALEGTGLGYGDMFGQSSKMFGYEVDGLDYIMRDGLPFPAVSSPAPGSTTIIAMGLASNTEINSQQNPTPLYYGDSAPFLAQWRYGSQSPEAISAASRGSGMIVHFSHGKGEVLNAGSSEWVAGLADQDPFAVQITANVLRRFGVGRLPSVERGHAP